MKYGTHAYDQWSADELIALAKGGLKGATFVFKGNRSGQIADRLVARRKVTITGCYASNWACLQTRNRRTNDFIATVH